jgi:hypothetical protein
MLGVQLNLDGDSLVVCNNIVVGLMVDDNADDCLGVLRILGNEYAEQVRLIKAGFYRDKDFMQWFVFCDVKQGELVISVKWEQKDIRGVIANYCYPMKVDNLIITWVKCKKVYIIKQSAIYVKRELTRLQVIK